MRRGFWVSCLLVACSETGFRADAPGPPPGGQGLEVPALHHEDRIVQVVNPVVDVLWVFDNSASMAGERAQVVSAFPNFMAPFEGAGFDFHIGVISTDMETDGHRGVLREVAGISWIDPETVDPASIFEGLATALLVPNASASTEERGREAVFTALETESRSGGANEGFLRDDPNGWLQITVITDEEDATSPQRLPISSFVDYLTLRKPYPGRLAFNSVVSWVNEGGATRGDSYMQISHAVGGRVESIHRADWDALLTTLADVRAPEAPRAAFYLSRMPAPASIDVHVTTPEGVTRSPEPSLDYVYDATPNRIVFEPHAVPPHGSLVRIAYQIR